ncbi:MAG TPA: hypothetical protein VKW04_19785 [Planctomycetota bacterium]|nr:hypothetical protein [Planctomycetota bacterium]
MKNRPRLSMLLAAASLLLPAGCAGAGSAHYGPSDHRRTVSADLGTTFYVSLPDTVTEKPVFSPQVLALGKDSVEEASRLRTLEFTARALGETEIRVGNNFSLKVQVTSVSDRPGMPLLH